MNKGWAGARTVALAAGALLLLTAAPAAHAHHSWSTFHWSRSSDVLTLEVIDATSSTWDSHLDVSIGDWNASKVLDLIKVSGDDRLNARKRCTAVAGKIKVCNAPYGFNGWLGIAEVWLSPGSDSHISQARARMNDSYFNTATYNDDNARRHVMCQEIGHVLGLDHQTAKSCMDDVNGLFDPDYVSPDAHDYEQLETIYGHSDSTSTTSSVKASKNRSGRKITVVFWARKK